MSSDSEDDCYGNIAQKLQSIKNKYKEKNKIEANLLDDAANAISIPKTVDTAIEVSRNDCEVLKADSDAEEISLDAIIANNTKKRATRSSKRFADISADNILPTRRRKNSRGGKKSSESVQESSGNDSLNQSAHAPSDTIVPASVNNTSRGRGRGWSRGRRRGRRAGNTANNSPRNINTSYNTQTNDQVSLPNFDAWITRPTHSQYESYPTYNIGNCAEYPDQCYGQPLFTNPTPKADVIVVGDNEPEADSIDENEELSVKVYWQNRELVKFTIRRFQRLTQIFDFFANRENVSHDKLFFTYNDKILKMDDTPDSIDYSIVKFIDGGIINQNVSKIVQSDRTTAKDGIKLKFQCQNVKKPFEMTIKRDDRMTIAMLMCAEQLETPLDKLKFYFDGDVVTGKNTARELELEGGECIDVRIIS